MKDTATVARNPGDREPAGQAVVDPELADQLLARAEAGGVELLGPDGLLSQVTKAVLERALAEEMTGAAVRRRSFGDGLWGIPVRDRTSPAQ